MQPEQLCLRGRAHYNHFGSHCDVRLHRFRCRTDDKGSLLARLRHLPVFSGLRSVPGWSCEGLQLLRRRTPRFRSLPFHPTLFSLKLTLALGYSTDRRELHASSGHQRAELRHWFVLLLFCIVTEAFLTFLFPSPSFPPRLHHLFSSYSPPLSSTPLALDQSPPDPTPARQPRPTTWRIAVSRSIPLSLVRVGRAGTTAALTELNRRKGGRSMARGKEGDCT